MVCFVERRRNINNSVNWIAQNLHSKLLRNAASRPVLEVGYKL